MTLYKQAPFYYKYHKVTRCLYYRKVCFASDSRSDRSGTAVSERPSATSATRPTRRCSFFLPHFSLPSSPLIHHFPLDYRRKTTANKLRSFPPSRPPLFSFPLFPSYVRQRRSTLSTQPQQRGTSTPSIQFLVSFSSFFLTFFLHFSCTSGTTTTHISP